MLLSDFRSLLSDFRTLLSDSPCYFRISARYFRISALYFRIPHVTFAFPSVTFGFPPFTFGTSESRLSSTFGAESRWQSTFGSSENTDSDIRSLIPKIHKSTFLKKVYFYFFCVKGVWQGCARLSHPSIAATRLFGLAQGILLQNLKGFDELKKMSRFSK